MPDVPSSFNSALHPYDPDWPEHATTPRIAPLRNTTVVPPIQPSRLTVEQAFYAYETATNDVHWDPCPLRLWSGNFEDTMPLIRVLEPRRKIEPPSNADIPWTREPLLHAVIIVTTITAIVLALLPWAMS